MEADGLRWAKAFVGERIPPLRPAALSRRRSSVGMTEGRAIPLRQQATEATKGGQGPAGTSVLALQNGERPAAGALRKACEEFEGLFVAMLFRAMRATVPREGLLSGGSAGEIFDSMWAEELGRAAARSGPLGIGEMLLGALGAEGEGERGEGRREAGASAVELSKQRGEAPGGSSEGRELPKRGVEAAGGVRRPGRRMK